MDINFETILLLLNDHLHKPDEKILHKKKIHQHKFTLKQYVYENFSIYFPPFLHLFRLYNAYIYIIK
jgi:hypothetical protein